MSKDTFFITTAIDYTNAPPHIGHAYEKVLADTVARFHRQRGRRVFFLSGVDQHGQKVKLAAERRGQTAEDFARETTAHFTALWDLLDVRFDGWAETTDPRHSRVVQAVLQRLHDNGDLYKARHVGPYSVRAEQFLTDKERGPDGEFGPEWGEVVHLEEDNWYFRLSRYRPWLADYVAMHPEFVTPAFRGAELAHALSREAGDLCISRPRSRLAWGIPLPFDEDYVTYVWFDALLNYISFAGFLSGGDLSLPDFARLWPCDAHVIGKDILVPAHGIYWPAMLKAAGFDSEAMPRLLVHGWWNLGGAKLSKSSGVVVDPRALALRYGTDALRYYLMRDIATGQDADFSEERLIGRYNADLANDLGNLVNRTVSMAARYRGGVLAAVGEDTETAALLRSAGEAAVARAGAAMETYQVHALLEAAWELVRAANTQVEAAAPWKLARDPAQGARLDGVLAALISAAGLAVELAAPVLPDSARRLLGQLGWPEEGGGEPRWRPVSPGHALGTAEPVFPKIEPPPAA